MARWLYRLGLWSARRAWAVILAWVVLLGVLGAGAATLARPYTSKITIPGTEFQSVIDNLQQALPKAAGGTGTAVFATADGQPFTAAQKQAVDSVVQNWSHVDGVQTATNPFTVQQKLDDAATKVKDAHAQLTEGSEQVTQGRAKLDAAEKKITAGRQEIAVNQKKLDAGQAEIDAATEKLQAGQTQLDAAKAKIATGQKQLDAAKAKAADGQKQLDAAQAKLTASKAKLDTGQAELNKQAKQLAAKKSQLEAGQAELAASKKSLTAQQQQVDKALAALPAQIQALKAAMAGLDPSDPAYADLSKKLAAAQQQQSELQATRAKIAAGLQEIAAQQREADAGAAQIAAGEKKLAEAQHQITAGRAKLAAGQQQITENQRKLTAGQQEIAANQAKLDAGRREVATNQATITAGREKIAVNQQKIDDGRHQIKAATAKLDAGEAKVRSGRAELAAAEQKVRNGQAPIIRAQRQLALTKNVRMVSENGSVALSQISFTEPLESVSDTTKSDIQAGRDSLAGSGVELEFSSEISRETSGIGSSEGIGLLIAAVVLFVTLGSLLAAGLPLLNAIVGVGVGLLGVEVVTHFVQMSNVTPILAMMLGLAVGIDYTLFLVNRHRHQLVQGTEMRESIGRACGTAGSAVLVAGLTVITALVALTLTRMPFLSVMGLAAAATVAVAVLVALTLAPALLRLIGPRILSRKGRARLVANQEAGVTATGSVVSSADAGARGSGWGGFVTRHPVATLVASVVVLATLAIPTTALRLGLPDGSNEPAASTAHKAHVLTTDNFGPGANGPIIAVATVPEAKASGLSKDEVTDLQLDIAERLHKIAGISSVVPASASENHQTLVFQITPTTGPADEATTTLVHTLRAQRDQIIEAYGLTSLGFAGQTVANIDISSRIAGVLPFYLTVVIGISLVLLLLVFRSLVVPVLATAGFLLSIAASFGAVVAVYQWGWLGSLFGVEHPGPILSFLPILAIGILFGLAMDYQMFLVTGMREAWAHGQDARTAVRSGFSHGARVITAAGLIMTAVFAGFIFTPLTMARPIGFALAIGVLIDAFVVRMTIMPALMHLFEEKAWYIPGWLDRVLPNLDVEGAGLVTEEQQSAVEAPADPVSAAV